MAVLTALGRALDAVAGTAALGAIMLVCYEASARYLAPRFALDWSTEVVIYLLVWGTGLTAARASFEHRHVAANVLIDLAPHRLRSAAYLFSLAAGAGFGLFLTIKGGEVTAFTARFGLRSDSSLRLPLWSYYAVLPTIGTLMTAGCALRLWLFARHVDHRLPPAARPFGGGAS